MPCNTGQVKLSRPTRGQENTTELNKSFFNNIYTVSLVGLFIIPYLPTLLAQLFIPLIFPAPVSGPAKIANFCG
jgi:hypothetical protein